MAATAEQRVLEAAKLWAATRRSFTRIRTSKRYNGREVSAARSRRDAAADLLMRAVEELEQ